MYTSTLPHRNPNANRRCCPPLPTFVVRCRPVLDQTAKDHEGNPLSVETSPKEKKRRPAETMSAASNNPRNSYALLQYYLREKLWRHAQALAADVFTALNDFTFKLWHAFTLSMEGSVADALREYKLCEGKRGVHVAALVGLRLIYLANNDLDGADAIDARLAQEERHPNHSALLQAAYIMFHAGEASKAKDFVGKVLDSDADFRDEYTSVQLARGWTDMTSGRGTFVDRCGQMFDRVLQAEAVDSLVDIDAILGKVAVFEKKNQFYPAQELLNKCIVSHPTFVPAHVVKVKHLMRVEDWDQASEVTAKLLAKDPLHVEALILATLSLLVRESRVSTASRNIADLIKALQHKEPRNASLYVACAQCFSRLAGGSLPILTLTTTLAEAASQIQPNNGDITTEVAQQSMMRGDHRTAADLFRKLSASGDTSVLPVLGLVKCMIVGNQLDEAKEKIEFLTEIQSSSTKNAELLFLTAMVLWRRERDQKGSLEKLDQAVAAHQADFQAQASGMELYVKLNAHMMLEMAKEYVQHCRTEPAENLKADPITEKTRRVLEQLLRHVPGSTEAQLLSSRMAFVSGDVDKASSSVAACIRQDQSQPEAHLLQAKIFQFVGNYGAAAQALEQALALDFDVNDSPQFNLLRGVLLYKKDDFAEALTCLERAVKIIAPKTEADAAVGKKLGAATMSLQDQVSLYLQLAQCHLRLKNPPQAQRVINEAAALFKETHLSGRVVIARALLMSRTDVDAALALLRTIPKESPSFLNAKSEMANLYLAHRGNRHAFARCYEEVVEMMPSLTSFMHLGDAYASIQEPDKAIKAYEKARAMDPNSAELAIKIGRTLVTTHDYQKALKYYKDAVAAEGNKGGLRIDLACLHWRLGDHDRAVQVLRDAPVMRRAPAQDDLAGGIERVNITLLQAKVSKSGGDLQSAVESLIQARVFQQAVVTKARGDSPEVLQKQRQMAATICIELGDFYAAQRNADKAITFYNESLKHDETNVAAMMALSKIYLGRGDLDACEQQCNALLRVQPACEDAIVMLADLMHRRGRYEDSAFHFLQLLEKRPDNFNAMEHYVALLRRAGHLSEAPAVFTNAEKLIKSGLPADPGLCYSKGMYLRYTGSAREALKTLNRGRQPLDNPWSQKCLVAMIETYTNPDNTNVWEDVESRPEVADNLQTAEKLLPGVEDAEKRALLRGHLLIASKRKESLDKALTSFYEVAESAGGDQSPSDAADDDALKASPSAAAKPGERIHVGALVGMAVALQVMKQTPKARNHLKRLMKNNATLTSDDDDAMEKGYLLLSSIHIESGKYDLAQDLLKRALNVNKSCCRAWELMGLIYEKEQSYRDASDCYEQAWRLMDSADPGVGFKLAFNYLKARRHVQAIDVCHKVLESHPTYPKIRKEILDRARSSLRP
jgi:tetratricopeptide repeat protein 21B